MVDMKSRDVFLAAALAVACVAAPAGGRSQAPQQRGPVDAHATAVLQKYRPVTAARLQTPEDSDWLMLRRTYNGWGFSPLSQITTANVSQLQLAWTLETGVTNGHEAPPIVNGGVMFVSTPGNQVIAIEAATGRLLWRYQRPLPDGVVLLHPTTRGVALYDDKVFFAANEAVLVAIDARTGREVWTARVEDNSKGYYMTMAPLVADGKVMVSASGGEFGVRGFLAAFDIASGKEVWRTYSVPAPGEPGSETWPKGDHWKNGGAPIWITGNYDLETNLAFWGTGNGGPWMGDQRPGDNLYTASTIAIDVATGAIKGHFQYHPNDSWDWDEVSPPILVDYARNGKTIKGLIDVARNGYLWFLERTADRINFVDGTPFVKQNVFRSLDPKPGRPDVDPARKPGHGQEGGVLSLALGRQELAPDRLQSTDADDLRTGQREPLLQHDWQAGELHRGTQLHRREQHADPGAWRHARGRGPGVECRHRQAGLDPHVPDFRELGTDARDRRGTRVQRRSQRSQIPCIRRIDGQGSLGVHDELRRHRTGDLVHGRWPAVHRRAVRLGHRRESDAEQTAQAHPIGSRSAGGWGGVGLRAQELRTKKASAQEDQEIGRNTLLTSLNSL